MNDFITIDDLKKIISGLPGDMLVIIPVVDEDNVNSILGFRKTRTAGILTCDREECSEVLCLNGASGDMDIAGQVDLSGLDIGVKEVLYGRY